jgi:hypothetical protein
MVTHICEKCNKEFTKKSTYVYHINKKIPCVKQNNIIVKTCKKVVNNKNALDLTCRYCLKGFCRKDVLQKHILGKCKIKKKDDEEKNEIFKQLLEREKLERDKRELEIEKQIFEKDRQLFEKDKQISNLLKATKKSNKINKLTNNIQNNIQNNNLTVNNNIQVTQFGKEDLSKISKEHYTKIVSNVKSCGYKFITDVVKSIHFNNIYPEFHNIYISDINREKCMIYDGKNWKLLYLDKNNNIISDIIDKTVNYSYENNDELKEKYKDNNFIQKRIEIINKYIEKCDNDRIQDLVDEQEENPNNKNKKIIDDSKLFKDLVSNNIRLLLYNEKNIVAQKLL